ncbi:lysine transporter LysE [Rickettsia rhipicephali]|nr:lysine transporter LysE [Rickettsia rhipicephali]
MFICIWFLSWAIIGYNIRKLNKNAIILKIINKIGAVTIWSIIALVY